jgi:membrane associated rhomboid family serine protease
LAQELPQALSTEGDKTHPPVFNVPTVVLVVIAALAVIHVVRTLGGEELEVWSVYAFAFSPLRFLGEAAIAQLPGSRWWSFVTSGLLHIDWMHLGFNSAWMAIFGTPVARTLGAGRFLLLALITTVTGALGTLLVHWGESIFMMGASSAVSGMTAAAVPIMFGRGRKDRGTHVAQSLSLSEYVSHSSAMAFTLLWLAFQILPQWLFGTSSLVTGTAFLEERPIAWEAHIGGFIGGLIAFYAMRALLVAKSSALR